MINVIIIDDEPLVTLGLSKLLQKEGCNITTFDSPMPALDYIKQDVQVDIVISDIQMPNMDGIELCFEVKKRHNAEIIIISGHQNFDYAKRTVELSAEKYVLKPINQQEFLALMRETVDKIQKRKVRNEKDLKKSAYVISKYLSDVANGVNTFDFHEIEETMPFFENTDGFCVATLMLPALLNVSAEPMRSVSSEIREMLEKQLRESAAPRKLILCEYRPGRFLIMLEMGHSQCLPLMRTAGGKIQDLFELDTICSLSAEHSGFAQIRPAVEESLYTLQFILDNDPPELIKIYDPSIKASSVEDFAVLGLMRFQHYSGLFMDYALDIAGKGCTETVVDQLFSEFDSIKANKLTIQKQCERLLLCILYECSKLFTNENREFEKIGAEISHKLESALGIQDVRKALIELLDSIAHILKELHNKKNNNIIALVDHLLASGSKTITLKSAAEYLGIHPSYFSVVFKEKSGVNFKDYVTDYKMGTAKKLLGNRNSKVYQIAEQLGYFDTDYFSRVFKKKYGITPKEYRESLTGTPTGV